MGGMGGKAMKGMENIDAVGAYIKRMQNYKKSEMETLFNAEESLASRISAIRGVRNNTYHEYVPQMIALLQDDAAPSELRVAVAEALGWFTLSPRKGEIVAACSALRTSDKDLAAELQQTILRLR